MNPLTQVKRIQKINSTEAALGISDEASWHAKYKGSAYIFAGGIPFQLTEGDLIAIFAQYGEVVDVNLVRDKATGKSRGFAFLAYEDQRSTILAVDNLNGASILGRIIRVDHVSNYKKKEEEEDEEKERQKREARGVCYAFQRGECNRGASCKFSHDEQRNANTGWGSKESNPKWDHDKYKDPTKTHNKYSQRTSDHHPLQHRDDEGEPKSKSMDKHVSSSRSERNHVSESLQKESRWKSKDQEGDNEKLVEKQRSRTREKEDRQQQTSDKIVGRRISEQRQDDDADRRGSEKRTREKDSSLHSRREKSEQYERGSHR